MMRESHHHHHLRGSPCRRCSARPLHLCISTGLCRRHPMLAGRMPRRLRGMLVLLAMAAAAVVVVVVGTADTVHAKSRCRSSQYFRKCEGLKITAKGKGSWVLKSVDLVNGTDTVLRAVNFDTQQRVAFECVEWSNTVRYNISVEFNAVHDDIYGGDDFFDDDVYDDDYYFPADDGDGDDSIDDRFIVEDSTNGSELMRVRTADRMSFLFPPRVVGCFECTGTCTQCSETSSWCDECKPWEYYLVERERTCDVTNKKLIQTPAIVAGVFWGFMVLVFGSVEYFAVTDVGYQPESNSLRNQRRDQSTLREVLIQRRQQISQHIRNLASGTNPATTAAAAAAAAQNADDDNEGVALTRIGQEISGVVSLPTSAAATPTAAVGSPHAGTTEAALEPPPPYAVHAHAM